MTYAKLNVAGLPRARGGRGLTACRTSRLPQFAPRTSGV